MVFGIFKDVFKTTAPEKTYKNTMRIAIDVTGFLITFCFYYCLMLFLYYFQYSVGNCDFNPLLYLASVLIFYGVHKLFYVFVNPIIPSAISLILCFLVFAFYPIGKLKILLAIVLLIFAAMEFLTRDKKINKSGIGDALYLKLRNKVWGIGIGILMILHFLVNANGTDRSIKPTYCLTIMTGVLCVYIVLVFIDKYLKLFHNFFRRKKTIHPVMGKQVKKVLIFAGTFASGVGVIVFLFSGYFSKLLTIIFGGILKMLSKININPIDTSNQEETRYMEHVINESSGDFSTHSLSGTSAGKFLAAIVSLAVAILVILGLIKILKSFSRFSFSENADEDMAEDKREFIVSTEKKHRHLSRAFVSGNNERIRVLYIKLLKIFKKRKVLKKLENMTSGDIASEISDVNGCAIDIRPLTDIYDAARYSGEVSSKEAVEKAKEYSDKLVKQVPGR